jgi:hypothetical protein
MTRLPRRSVDLVHATAKSCLSRAAFRDFGNTHAPRDFAPFPTTNPAIQDVNSGLVHSRSFRGARRACDYPELLTCLLQRTIGQTRDAVLFILIAKTQGSCRIG